MPIDLRHFVPPGIPYCWVDTGNSNQKRLPGTPTQDWLWELNFRLVDLKFVAEDT